MKYLCERFEPLSLSRSVIQSVLNPPYITASELGAYWVVPDLRRPDLLHVSRLCSDGPDDDGGLFDGTRWAESADLVEIRLKGFQLTKRTKQFGRCTREPFCLSHLAPLSATGKSKSSQKTAVKSK